ncbi:MAG: LysE family transporter [Candidatus Peregrinibacteria bacterium]|nr:LysE family transporter [Candidatus Peregrinibacteria bacterium]
MRVFANGLLTGLILQTAIGPVFFFIINLALQRSLYDGLVAVAAVTLVDYFYISLAILGIGKLLEKKKIKKAFGIISSLVLIIIGIIIIKNIPTEIGTPELTTNSSSLLTSFSSVFFLTISNPMTIVFFTGVFSAKAIEYNYTKHQLWIFGLSVGLATFLFMGSSVIVFSLLKKPVPILLIQTLNVIVGCLLILYGAIRLKPVLKNSA